MTGSTENSAAVCRMSTEPSPLQEGEDGGILTVDPGVEEGQKDAVASWRSQRDDSAVGTALDELSATARDEGTNIMPATLACARLNATSALLAHLRQETAGRAAEQGLLNRIWGALTVPAPSRNGTWKAHE